MWASSDIGFKEWAIVVETLGRGEQCLILRKGGIRETKGEFQVDHQTFWLFPTQYHEAEQSIIPSKRVELRELAARAPQGAVDIEFLAVTEDVIKIENLATLKRLQGRHIWTEAILEQRFQFGREAGLHALITRVYRLASPHRFPVLDSYGGCKSWIQLEHPIAAEATPVLSDAEFSSQQIELMEILGAHALAHP